MGHEKKLLIIAGPQASGKTSALKFLEGKYPKAQFLHEINPFTVAGRNHLGGAFTGNDLQEQIARADLKRAFGLRDKEGLFVIETGIFGLVYYEKAVGKSRAQSLFEEYISCYQNLNPVIVFIDTLPGESWCRREARYIERTQRFHHDLDVQQAMLSKYKDSIFHLYPIWIKYYCLLPFNKTKIENSTNTIEQFIQKVDYETAQIISTS